MTRWPFIIDQKVAQLLADAPLVALLGGPHVYKNRTKLHVQVPGVYWKVISTVRDENTDVVLVQWNIWAKGVEQGQAIEERLLGLMDSEQIQTIDGVKFWNKYVDGRDMDIDEGDDPGVYHRSLDFRYTVEREA